MTTTPTIAERDAAAERLYDYITEWIDEHHYPPTHRQAQQALGIRERRTLELLTARLIEAGRLSSSWWLTLPAEPEPEPEPCYVCQALELWLEHAVDTNDPAHFMGKPAQGLAMALAELRQLRR